VYSAENLAPDFAAARLVASGTKRHFAALQQAVAFGGQSDIDAGGQSSRLAEFGGLGMSFNICRGTLGSLAMLAAAPRSSGVDNAAIMHGTSRERTD
jgi:hypothetical protein